MTAAGSLKVVDNYADMVHPPNRHIPARRRLMFGDAGER
jgi:hypothetical protein